MGLDCFIWGIGIKMHPCGPASTVNLKRPASHPPQVQPETLAVIKWMQNYNFILSANLHGGAVVANYPFDKSRDGRIRGRTTYSATPDDKIFRKVRDRLKFPDVTHISYRHCLLCGYENTCPFVCDDSWRGPTHTLTAGCTRAGTVATTLMRGSPMGPAGTRCPKVSKTSSPEQKGRQQKCVVKAQETHLEQSLNYY